MIKLLIFDLDGVLVASKEAHFVTLNKALEDINPLYVISKEEHLALYEGLSTTKKLELLTKKNNLPKELHNIIWQKKQFYTLEFVKKYSVDQKLVDIMEKLVDKGYIIHVASNSIRITIETILRAIGIYKYISFIVGNDDVKNPKPNAEMHFKCMMKAMVSVNETLILEDSPIGKEAVKNCGAHLLEIDNPQDVTLDKIYNEINFIERLSPCKKLSKFKCNIVIPMAGEGSRFVKDGYTRPKPLIDVKGRPMIKWVVDNFNIDCDYATFIFIVRKEHYTTYNLDIILPLMCENCKIIQVEGITEGAACSILLAKDLIDTTTPLIIANSDQYVEWNFNNFIYAMSNDEIDGGIATFTDTDPKWSFVKLNDQGYVAEVAEKKVISDLATVGIYYWKHGRDFVSNALEMIRKNIRVNNEFYTCPVFNEAILNKKKIKIYNVDKMWGLGTPSDLKFFLNNKLF